MSKIYLVQASHWSAPGVLLTAHRTERGAKEKAAEFVNVLRQDLGLVPCATPKDWRERLATARRKRARQMGRLIESLGSSDADVWIDSISMQD